jgi:uncharacterized membrane protein
MYLANVVGMHATVPPNEYNTLATALKDREAELDRRERTIDARAQDAITPLTSFSSYVVGSILALQLILIVLNYILDYHRARKKVPPTGAEFFKTL